MKTIILIRHAKSSWKDMSLDDFDRPLNSRGKRDAPIIAKYMQSQKMHIDKIFSSSAKRAKETAIIFAETIDLQVEYYEELYMTSTNKLLLFIENKLKKHNSIAIVSHNPELTELNNYLTNQYIANIPTSAYVVLELNESNIKKGSCKLVDFVYPKRKDICVN